MAQKFQIDNGDHKLNIYIGEPAPDSSPTEFQARYFAKLYGVSLPHDITDSFSKLHEVAKVLRVPLSDLVAFIFGKIEQKQRFTMAIKNLKGINNKPTNQ